MPLIPYLFLVLYAMKGHVKSFFSILFIVFSIGSLYSLIIDPSFDNGAFLTSLKEFQHVSDVLLDARDAFSPTASGMWLSQQIFFAKPYLGTILFNSINIAVSYFFISKSFPLIPPASPFSSRLLVFLFLLTVSPTLIVLLETANKDLTILAAMSCLFYSSSRHSHRLTFSISNITLFASSSYVLFFARLYFLQIFIASLFFTLVFLYLKNIFRFQPILGFSLFVAYVVFALSLVLTFFWEDIRKLVYTYEGNAVVRLVFDAPQPSIIEAPFYIFLGFITYITAPFFLFLTNPMITFAKFAAGAIEQYILLFSALTVVRFVYRNNTTFFYLFATYFVSHISIQIWGSPNYGSLFRLRIFEYCTLLWILVIFYNQNLLYKNNRTQSKISVS